MYFEQVKLLFKQNLTNLNIYKIFMSAKLVISDVYSLMKIYLHFTLYKLLNLFSSHMHVSIFYSILTLYS